MALRARGAETPTSRISGERLAIGAEQQVLPVVEEAPRYCTRRARPPGTRFASNTLTAQPARASSTAAASPA